MLLRSEGFVLQAIKYGESSQICKVLSKDKGIISLISARTKKKNTFNYFQPLTPIFFVCYFSNKKSIHRVKEVSRNPVFNASPDNITVSALRFFLAEFLSKVIREEEENVFLYEQVANELVHFYNGEINASYFHIAMLINLLNPIGITPDFNESGEYFDLIEGSVVHTKPTHQNFFEGEAKKLLQQAMKQTFPASKKQRLHLLNLLLSYYDVQLNCGLQNLKSKAILEAVFTE